MTLTFEFDCRENCENKEMFSSEISKDNLTLSFLAEADTETFDAHKS